MMYGTRAPKSVGSAAVLAIGKSSCTRNVSRACVADPLFIDNSRAEHQGVQQRRAVDRLDKQELIHPRLLAARGVAGQLLARPCCTPSSVPALAVTMEIGLPRASFSLARVGPCSALRWGGLWGSFGDMLVGIYRVVGGRYPAWKEDRSGPSCIVWRRSGFGSVDSAGNVSEDIEALMDREVRKPISALGRVVMAGHPRIPESK